MARDFLGDDFLLGTKAAIRLFREHAVSVPIYDYHCHLPVKEIAENRQFENLSQVWLAGDHYKWRAMRANGVPERLITGDATDLQKFEAWAATVPSTLGNPLYHWTHLELARYFGVKGMLLTPSTARQIYDSCTAQLRTEQFRVQGLLRKMNVRVICTTDDPTDSLLHHESLRADRDFPITVVPAFRPDEAMAIESPKSFNGWLSKLAKSADMDIRNYKTFLDALRLCHARFHEHGCRLSDHALEEPYAEDYTEAGVSRVFAAARKGAAPTLEGARAFKSALLVELGRMNAEKKWAMQLHMGALRNVNSRGMKSLGPNTGYDAIGGFPIARSLAKLLDRLDSQDALPRTILYSLNPTDNAQLAAMTGCFQDGSVPGKIQHGAAWWFNDQRDGMTEQLRMLASMGLLARFVGMLTDSRSFLSFPRHEYFRRVLCGLLGTAMENGEIPRDFGLVGRMVEDICWNNAAAYFGIPQKGAMPARRPPEAWHFCDFFPLL